MNVIKALYIIFNHTKKYIMMKEHERFAKHSLYSHVAISQSIYIISVNVLNVQ